MASLVHASDRRLWRFTEDTALFLAPALALAAPWLIKSFVYTGDPLYPILWKYLGGVEWSDTLSDQFWRWQRSIGMGRTCRDFLLLPVRVILFGGGDYGHFAAWISKSWILLIPLTVIASPLIPIVRWCLIPAALYFAVWALGSQQTRFLIAVLPLLAAAAGITLSRIVTGVNRWLAGRDTQGQADTRLRMLGHVLAGSVVAGCLVILAWASRYVVPVAVALSHDLRANPPTLQTWTPDPVFSYIRENLPASARVMLLNTNQAFFVDRDYIADSFFEASQLNALIREAVDREGLTALFERLTITHVLFKEDEPWVQFPPALRQYLSDRATATRIYASPGGAFTLYELRARAPVTHALGFERAGGRGSRVRRARADTHRREVEARFRPEMDIRVG